jgi:hypothetical protein
MRPGLLYRAALEGATFSLYAGETQTWCINRGHQPVALFAASRPHQAHDSDVAVQAWCYCNNTAQQQPRCACVEAGPKTCCGNRSVSLCSAFSSGMHWHSSTEQVEITGAAVLPFGCCRLLQMYSSCR